jgi:DedD protein
MRQKIEKSGLKTYTQALSTPSGRRIRVRVGPFSSKAQAEQALYQLKTTGVVASVVSLD